MKDCYICAPSEHLDLEHRHADPACPGCTEGCEGCFESWLAAEGWYDVDDVVAEEFSALAQPATVLVSGAFL